MAGRIGIMLGLDADGVVVPVDMALLAVNRVREFPIIGRPAGW